MTADLLVWNLYSAIETIGRTPVGQVASMNKKVQDRVDVRERINCKVYLRSKGSDRNPTLSTFLEEKLECF